MLAAFRSWSAPIAWPSLVAMAFYLNGCVAYTERRIPNTEPLIVGPEKILVLHSGSEAWELDAPVVEKDGLKGRTVSLMPKPYGEPTSN
jgi:hypothetical protein